MDIHEKQVLEADPAFLMVKSGSGSSDSDSKKTRRLCLKVKIPNPRKDQHTLSVQQLYQSVTESQPQSEPQISKTRRCEECGKEFSSGKAFGGHVRVHMKGNKKNRNSGATPATTRAVTHLSSSPRGKEDEKIGKPNLNEGEIKCYVCNKDFQSMKSLFGHMSRHPERDWRGVRPPNVIHQAPAPPPTPTPPPESNSSNTTGLYRSSFSSGKEEEEMDSGSESESESETESKTESETESETSNGIPSWTRKGKRGRNITEEMIPAALCLMEMKHYGKPINIEKANEIMDKIKSSKKKKKIDNVDHHLKKIPKSKTLTLNKGKEKMHVDSFKGSKKNSPDYSRRSKGIVIAHPEEQQRDDSDLADIMVQPLNQWVPLRSSNSSREKFNPLLRNGSEGRKKLNFDLNELPENQLDVEDGTQA